MIRLARGPEPDGLAKIRAEELARVGAIATERPPTGDEIGDRYQFVRKDLWKAQSYKCCFCDSKNEDKYRDVEHYRPKAEADRWPGSTDRSGYWWLAWTWENLLFSCPSCNRSHKRVAFPLDVGSTPLSTFQSPPGDEIPLLIDPSLEDPIDHIQFRLAPINGRDRWQPFPRRGSKKGEITIAVAGLDRPALIDLYDDHFEHHIKPRIETILDVLDGNNPPRIQAVWAAETKRLLPISLPFAALTFDAIDHFVPEPIRSRFDLNFKKPGA